MFWQLSLHALYPELYMGIMIMLMTVSGLFLKNAFRVIYAACLITVITTLIFVLVQPHTFQVALNGFWVKDLFSFYIKIFILLAVIFIIIMTKSSVIHEELAYFEYPIILLCSTLGMMMMISSNDFISLFMATELMSLSLYILIPLKKRNSASSEAGLKYFILGSLSTAIMLYGISWIYGFTGTTNFELIQRFLSTHGDTLVAQKGYLLVGVVCVIISFAFKVSAAPFHLWAPDVYQGTPTPIMTYLITVPKFAVFGVLLRLFSQPFHALSVSYSKIFTVISVASMLVGAYAALTQTSVRRFIAFSSIGQIGFSLLGLAIANEAGYRSTLSFMVFYMFSMIGLMGVFTHLSRRGYSFETLSDLNGLGRYHPGIAFTLGFFIFSLAGIPPLPGFLPKLLMIQSAIQNEFYIFSLIAVMYSVIAAAYYLLFIKAIFLDKSANTTSLVTLRTHETTSLILTYILVIALTAFLVFPSGFLNWTSHVVSSLVFL
jgi:NADH-quinone oxidoreductase subunit N